jgi:anti-sigma regulatory factor (Ser/Thr protein kinase)
VTGLDEVELSRDAHAPRLARRLISERFASQLEADELISAMLLTSELVTNAVRHGHGRITLTATMNEDRLLVEVTDEGSGLERTMREHSLENIEGWGLKIVDAESARWGAHEGTTHVWFEIERQGPRLGAEKISANE